MQNTHSLIARYLETFNETDSGRRRELLESLYTPDCTYTDPQMDLRGADQIDAFIQQTHEQFPGIEFTLGGDIDAHHDQARFQWHAGPPDAPDAVIGFDVIVTQEGQIRHVYGFMDRSPAA